MNWDLSYEDALTEGFVQIVRLSKYEMNCISFIFESKADGKKKEVSFTGVIHFSMEADDQEHYDSDMDIMAYRTLIGFDCRNEGDIYIYIIKIDDYEIEIRCVRPFTWHNVS